MRELPDGRVVVLDSASLTLICAQAMPQHRTLVVLTNNLPAPRFLAANENFRLITCPACTWRPHRRR
jgi:DeoR family fructose operon transcriptional repressor